MIAFSTTIAGWADLFFLLGSIWIVVWFILRIMGK